MPPSKKKGKSSSKPAGKGSVPRPFAVWVAVVWPFIQSFHPLDALWTFMPRVTCPQSRRSQKKHLSHASRTPNVLANGKDRLRDCMHPLAQCRLLHDGRAGGSPCAIPFAVSRFSAHDPIQHPSLTEHHMDACLSLHRRPLVAENL